jgi:hypothetical protein
VIEKNNNNNKSVFCPCVFQASAAPRPENANSDEKDALFGLDTQITILSVKHRLLFRQIGVTRRKIVGKPRNLQRSVLIKVPASADNNLLQI